MRENTLIKARNLSLACAIAGSLLAATAHADAAQDVAAFQNFQLTDAFIAKYQAVETDTAKDVCKLSPFKVLMQANADKDKIALDQVAAQYDAQPGVHAMLASHGMTAKDMILGMFTLMSAAAQDLNRTHPGMVQTTGAAAHVSAANMDYYHQHKDALHAFQKQLGQQELHANGGKLPACMMH